MSAASVIHCVTRSDWDISLVQKNHPNLVCRGGQSQYRASLSLGRKVFLIRLSLKTPSLFVARNAALTFMYGGRTDVSDQVRPPLDLMSKTITLVGDVVAGQVATIANHIIVALDIEAVAEALVVASKWRESRARGKR